MTARSSKANTEQKLEINLNNEGHSFYTSAVKQPLTFTKQQVRTALTALRTAFPDGTWTADVWTSPDGSDGRLVFEIDSDGTENSTPVQTKQVQRTNSLLSFRSGKEQMVAAALLTSMGMKGLTQQVLDNGADLKFSDGETAEQAEEILGAYDLGKLAAKKLR